MRLLYLDDSGSVNDPNQDYLVLGGVCVPESGVRWLSYELEKIAEKINPDHPAQVEFHAVDIFGGKGTWKTLSDKQARIDMIRRVLHVLDNASESTFVFAVAIQKSTLPKRIDPILKAYELIAQSFNNHLELDFSPSERGIIILDNTSYETGLQNLASEIRRAGNRIGSQNRSIIEIPLFVDSSACRLVQLADHIAYSVFRRYNANDINYFNVIENKFINKNGVIRSLTHLNNSAACTCPACLTRRDRG